MTDTLSGMSMDSKFLQPLKAAVFRVVSPLLSVMFLSPRQYAKALNSIVFTELGT